MKIHILSDLHLEFQDMPIPDVNADITIIAGDIHLGMKGLRWLRQIKRPVIYILGNHEFYGFNTDTLKRQFNIQKRVRYLENNWAEVNGIKIFGCTLWTDFKLFGDDCFFAYSNAKRFLNDFTFIKDVKMKQWHKDSVASIKKFIKQDGNKVIVTHHAPSIQSVGKRWRTDALTPAFASNLESLIMNSGAKLWIHGHTHESCDYMIGETRVVCNPRGYPQSFNKQFDPNMVIEV